MFFGQVKGRVTTKAAPLRCSPLRCWLSWTRMVPPCWVAIRWATNNPSPTPWAFPWVKTGQNSVAQGVRDSFAAVFNNDNMPAGFTPGVRCAAHPERAFSIHAFNGIQQQVDEHLLQLIFIPPDPVDIRFQILDHINFFLTGVLKNTGTHPLSWPDRFSFFQQHLKMPDPVWPV